MKHALLPVAWLVAVGCSDGNSRQNTCGAGVQGLVRDDLAQKPLDLTKAPGGLLKMNADVAGMADSYCNAFPMYNPQTKSFLVISGLHCLSSTFEPKGEFFLSLEKGYIKADSKEIFREKLTTAIAANKSFGPKAKAIFNDKLSIPQIEPGVRKCQSMTRSLPPELLSQYSVACFSGSDLRVAQINFNPTGKFKADFDKLKKNTVELGKADDAAGFEHQKAFASIALAREFAIQSAGIVEGMKKLSRTMAGNEPDPDLIKELSTPEAQKNIVQWEWDYLAPLIGLREMDKTLAASAVVPQQLMTFKEFEEFAKNSEKIIEMQRKFVKLSGNYDSSLYNLAKKNVKTDDVKLKFTVTSTAQKMGDKDSSRTSFLSLGKAVTLDKLSDKDELGIQFDDKNNAVLLLVKKREKNQILTFLPTDSGSALMGDDGVIALTLVTWDSRPVEGIMRPPITVEPHVDTQDAPPAMANDKDKKPGKTTTTDTPAKQNEGGGFGDLASAFAKILRADDKPKPENTDKPITTEQKTNDDKKQGEQLPPNDRGQIVAIEERNSSDSGAQKGSTSLGIKGCN